MFKYRKLSDNKIEKLNNIRYQNPERGGVVDFRGKNCAVISDDEEYCLFEFLPIPSEIDYGRDTKCTFFYGDNFIELEMSVEEGYERIIGGIKHRTKIIEIRRNEYFDKKENLGLLIKLKEALIENEQVHYLNDNCEKKMILCTVKYDGREI